MKGIIVHEVYTNNTIFIKISAIKAVRTIKHRGEEYECSDISIGEDGFRVNELFDEIMLKIREAESEDKT